MSKGKGAPSLAEVARTMRDQLDDLEARDKAGPVELKLSRGLWLRLERSRAGRESTYTLDVWRVGQSAASPEEIALVCDAFHVGAILPAEPIAGGARLRWVRELRIPGGYKNANQWIFVSDGSPAIRSGPLAADAAGRVRLVAELERESAAHE